MEKNIHWDKTLISGSFFQQLNGQYSGKKPEDGQGGEGRDAGAGAL